MQHFRNILVGIDLANAADANEFALTPPNQQALRRAVWLAGHTRGHLTIFSALDLSAHAQAVLREKPSPGADAFEHRAEEILQGLVDQARAQDVDAKAKLTFGVAWKEICQQVLSEGHDLVVAGTRDLGNVGRILYGSTGMKLLRTCPCPVWITRPDPNWDDLNILVPSELGDVSLEALRIAVNGGQLVDTKMHVLHAMEGQFEAPSWFGAEQKKMVHEYVVRQREEVRKRLHDQLALTDYRTLKYGLQVHVVDGPPEEAILKAIDDYQIDLVVMGTSGRSSLTSIVMGNTAERLISHMKCSVIAVKPPGFRCPLAVEAHTA